MSATSSATWYVVCHCSFAVHVCAFFFSLLVFVFSGVVRLPFLLRFLLGLSPPRLRVHFGEERFFQVLHRRVLLWQYARGGPRFVYRSNRLNPVSTSPFSGCLFFLVFSVCSCPGHAIISLCLSLPCPLSSSRSPPLIRSISPFLLFPLHLFSILWCHRFAGGLHGVDLDGREGVDGHLQAQPAGHRCCREGQGCGKRPTDRPPSFV